MRLNHLNLCVDNLDEARAFFEELLDFHLLDQKGEALAVLSDGQGFTLVLADGRRFGGETPVRYPDGFHVGFILATSEQVDRVFDRIVAANIAPDHRPRAMHGSYSFSFTALRSILFEVSCPVQ